MTTTVEIPKELDAELEALAARNGEDKNKYLREAIISFLEDQEDITVATERLNNPGKRLTFEQVKKNLGLDD
ncbi:MAG: ribbon-helix-helix protein, CopG family [Acidobacteriaceae bacterium]|jgi:RHH-type transcriptional regulator, rel operon repressor / antitoxin RelB